MSLWKIAIISAGGALGANARYWLGAWMAGGGVPTLPWPTMVINVSGSLVAGFASAWLARLMPDPAWRLLIITGFLGGYTTFSAFELEANALWLKGARAAAIAYIAGSVAVGFAAALIGIAAAEALGAGRTPTVAEVSGPLPADERDGLPKEHGPRNSGSSAPRR